MSAAVLDLVFDGQCGFCTRSALWLMRLDRRCRIRLHPAQRAGVRERFALSEEDMRSSAWAFSQGRRLSGAGAVSLALDTALGIRLFSMLYRLPLLHALEDRAYGWVATHRYLLRGVTPWCSAHPEDCELASPSASCALR